jgi:Protein of unknown function (DUF3572)
MIETNAKSVGEIQADLLRGGISETATLAAILSFLEGHEPDLVAAAEHIGTSPAALVRARQELEA